MSRERLFSSPPGTTEPELVARITVRKDGQVTKQVEVRLMECGYRIDALSLAVCRPATEADDAA